VKKGKKQRKTGHKQKKNQKRGMKNFPCLKREGDRAPQETAGGKGIRKKDQMDPGFVLVGLGGKRVTQAYAESGGKGGMG